MRVPDAPTPSPSPQGTVLFVDDEPAILATLRAACGRRLRGVRVLTASDAAEALRILERERVDVVVSDHRMPGMQGLDLLVEARRRTPAASRVLMTACPESDMALGALGEAQLERLFTKPVNILDVLRALGELLAARRAPALSGGGSA